MQEALTVLIVIAFASAAIWLGDPIVRMVFHVSTREPKRTSGSPNRPLATGEAVDGDQADHSNGGSTQQGEVSVSRGLRGGRWIGYLERIAVFAGLLAGFPGVLALTLAIKGLGRYPELRSSSPQIAERFIIGTFVSLLWACAMAGVTIGLLRLA